MSHTTTGSSLPPEAAPSRAELEEQVRQARRELGDALDQLTTRLSPSYQASQFAHGTKQALDDARGLFTGAGLPSDDGRARNTKILLGAAVAGVVAATVIVVRAARH